MKSKLNLSFYLILSYYIYQDRFNNNIWLDKIFIFLIFYSFGIVLTYLFNEKQLFFYLSKRIITRALSKSNGDSKYVFHSFMFQDPLASKTHAGYYQHAASRREPVPRSVSEVLIFNPFTKRTI